MLASARFLGIKPQGEYRRRLSRHAKVLPRASSNRARVWDGAELALSGFDTDPAGAIMAGVA